MPQHQFTPAKSPHIDHPPCPKCGAPMWLARIAEGPEHEKRIFECPVCEISAKGKVAD